MSATVCTTFDLGLAVGWVIGQDPGLVHNICPFLFGGEQLSVCRIVCNKAVAQATNAGQVSLRESGL